MSDKIKGKKSATKSMGAFDGLADMMNAGDLGNLTASNEQNFSTIVIDEILINPQIRKTLEDAENSLEDLANSIKEHGVFQPIIIRPVSGSIPFELVAGERRLRASMLAGRDTIPAMIYELTDEEAEEIQIAENIQRKNLTQIEIANKLQSDLDANGGDIEAVMAKRQKSRAWISKWLSLLELSEQARRVIDENVSADLEVINTVKQVEKVDPLAAEALVDDLKKSRGKENAREKAKAVKDKVKPPKKPRKTPENLENAATPESFEEAESGQISQQVDHEACVDIFADAKMEEAEALKKSGQVEPEEERGYLCSPSEVLSKIFKLVNVSGLSPMESLGCITSSEQEECKSWLHSFYDVGTTSKDIGQAVMQGFRSGSFATEGHGAFALVAFLYGMDSDAKFNMLNIIGSAKV